MTSIRFFLFIVASLLLTFNASAQTPAPTAPAVKPAPATTPAPAGDCAARLTAYAVAVTTANTAPACTTTKLNLLESNWEKVVAGRCARNGLQSPEQICGPRMLPTLPHLRGAGRLLRTMSSTLLVPKLSSFFVGRKKATEEVKKEAGEFVKNFRQRDKVKKKFEVVESAFTAAKNRMKAERSKQLVGVDTIRKGWLKTMTRMGCKNFATKAQKANYFEKEGLVIAKKKEIDKAKKDYKKKKLYQKMLESITYLYTKVRATCPRNEDAVFLKNLAQVVKLLPIKERQAAQKLLKEADKKSGANYKHPTAHRILIGLAVIDMMPTGTKLLVTRNRFDGLGNEVMWRNLKDNDKTIVITRNGPVLATKKGNKLVIAGSTDENPPPRIARFYKLPDGWAGTSPDELARLKARWKRDFLDSDEYKDALKDAFDKGKKSAKYHTGKRILTFLGGAPLLTVGVFTSFVNLSGNDNRFGRNFAVSGITTEVGLELGGDGIIPLHKSIALSWSANLILGFSTSNIVDDTMKTDDQRIIVSGFLLGASARGGINFAGWVTAYGHFRGAVTPFLFGELGGGLKLTGLPYLQLFVEFYGRFGSPVTSVDPLGTFSVTSHWGGRGGIVATF